MKISTFGVFNTLKKNVKSYRELYTIAAATLAFYRGIDAVFYNKRGSTDYIKSTISFAMGSPQVWGRPTIITIEPTTLCNLHCSVCETGAGILKRKQEHMSFESFKTIIDKVAFHTNTLMFYFMGEPFLNKEAYRMIRYAKDRGIPFITTCTNGDFVDPVRLIDSGIDEVSFQIGGMSQGTHGIYRINSNLQRVLSNLRETVEYRNRKRSKTRLVAGFILMKHNEHEVADFKRVMAKIGVDEAVVIDPCVRNVEQAREMLPTDNTRWYYDDNALSEGRLCPKISHADGCPWIYYSMVLTVNGDVVPCCRDAQGDYVMGNILREELNEILNNVKFKRLRSAIHGTNNNLHLCRLCSGYGVATIK